VTIGKGTPWGRQVDPPPDLIVVATDAELAARLEARRRDPAAPPVAARAGDMARTLGVDDVAGRATLNELPIDLLELRVGHRDGDHDDLRTLVGCAHVVMRRPWWRGGWWRGAVVVVMNAEFIGTWDVAPRGHPNDGRVEVFAVDAQLDVRQRLAASRRLRTATHVPHPLITTRSVRRASWTFEPSMAIVVDGVRVGRARRVELDVVPDAATVLA
jgi:hypothetical protein